MCKIMEETLEQEARESKERATVEYIKNLMLNLKLTAEQAMDALSIPKTEQTTYPKMI